MLVLGVSIFVRSSVKVQVEQSFKCDRGGGGQKNPKSIWRHSRMIQAKVKFNKKDEQDLTVKVS